MEEKKSTYRGNSDAQRRATAKYLNENVETFPVRVPMGSKERYKRAAASAQESLNQFVIKAMEMRIQQENLDIEQQ